MKTDEKNVMEAISSEELQDRKRYTSIEYKVFPGITLTYDNAHSHNGEFKLKKCVRNSMFEIFHCREGRMEFSIGEEYCYISPGDILIVRTERLTDSLYFPLQHYHGITISIDTDKAPKCLSCFLKDIAVRPESIAEKFCGEHSYFIARSDQSFEHIFSELYAIPEEIRPGYSKIKILELMLFLSVFDKDNGKSENRGVSPYQVSLAKAAAAYLMDNMEEKITLEQAANKYHVSLTVLKKAFKAVYGVPFYSYIKTQKIESAAYMLEYTDKTVTEIANEHGYDNASKFAAAFRSIKALAPLEYRARHLKKK
ncbi:MAG: helix-turn-helix transcriptional regulator [Ruminococcus sp.]|nr:helix-turn-helix transcriptional regulator [Ruminococcus sp.]